MIEEWKDITGFEGRYRVSNLGRVSSLERTDDRGGRRGGLILKSMRSGRRGHKMVHLQAHGSRTARSVHQLVMEAFVGPRPDGLEVCHNDGDPTNNQLDNLRYDTRSANALDAVRHGSNWLANKTHCVHGHPLSGSNLVVSKQQLGHRSCRACAQARAHAHKRGLPFDIAVADAKWRALSAELDAYRSIGASVRESYRTGGGAS